MGCLVPREQYDYGGRTLGISMDTEQAWLANKLPLVLIENFESEEERLLFKTINLVRFNPSWAIPYMMKAKHHPKYTGANIASVIRRL